MERYPPRSDQKTPEVESRASLKGSEDPKVDLKYVEDCNGEEASNCHCNWERDIDSPTVSLTRETVGHTCLCAFST